jgi:RelA/SpoT family (p)ppGpp synthetase
VLRQYELLEKVRGYDPDADEAMINRAYVFSMKAHGSQKRASGDPYYSHPIEVAGILTDLHLDDETIVTAILHDTIEDTVATPEEVEKLFGKNVARLVDGVTKLSKIEAQSESQRAAENLRKFLLAMSGDIRVLLVKLADRLHNMRTLHFVPSEEKRRRIARETMDIYAPLAERIGMYEFMTEMQTLAFSELEPDAFASISRRLEQLHKGGGDLIDRIGRGIKAHLEAHGIEAQVQGREKHPYSIWRKMAERHVSFEQLSDVMAFRVIVENVEDCYRTLGLIHQRWPVVPGRFKDFISTPKRNGYRSLHTTVIHDEQMRIEIQIRTQEMHAQAEFGLAAHWAYKEGKAAATTQHPWISDLIEILEHAGSAEELLEHTRMAMYQDRIFAFTPKGELIQLPKGATPVDFAYAVHTDLGDQTVGAKINGRVMPLRTPLDNGDQVEILVSKAQHPQPAWLSFVVTGKAKAKIRRFVKSKEREETIALGRKIFDEIVQRLPAPLGWEAMAEALRRLHLHDDDSLMEAIAVEAHRRRPRDGSADARLHRRQGHEAPAAAPGDLDQGPYPRRRLRSRRMLPPDPRRPNRRPSPRRHRHRGAYDRLRPPRRRRRRRLGRSRLGRRIRRRHRPPLHRHQERAGLARRHRHHPGQSRRQHRQHGPDQPRWAVPHLQPRHRSA